MPRADHDDGAKSVVASGFLQLFGSQLITRLLTFALNLLATRSLTPSSYGIAAVQFHLINTTILFLSREGFRRGCLRINPRDPNATAKILGTSMLSIPIGAFLSIAVTSAILYSSSSSSSSHASSTSFDQSYHFAIILQGIAAFLELLTEPFYILATARLSFRFRVACEAIATVTKNTLTLYLLYVHVSPAVSFSYGQIIYALTLDLGYFIYFWHHRSSIMSSFPSLDGPILRICGTFSIQTLGKLVLAEGSKGILAAATPAHEQGVYGLVNNLGSLVVRTVFQPYEEIAFVAFSRESEEDATDTGAAVGIEKRKKTTKDKSHTTPKMAALRAKAQLLSSMCRGICLLGIIAASFGPAYSHIVLFILYGKRWVDSGASFALAIYSQYIALLALNGTLEAFVHASADAKGLVRVNISLVVLSLLHIGLSVAGVKYAGALGLLVADSVNMGLRIVYCLLFLRRYFESIGGLNALSLWPKRNTLGVLVFSLIVTLISEAIFMPEARSFIVRQSGGGFLLVGSVQGWIHWIGAHFGFAMRALGHVLRIVSMFRQAHRSLIRQCNLYHCDIRGAWSMTSSYLHTSSLLQQSSDVDRETFHYDLCIVGAGPSGLAAAIRFKQLCNEQNKDLSVCIIEKGAEVGSHILSGNVFEPTALNELIPDWKEDTSCPITPCPVTEDRFLFFTSQSSIRLPTPPQMKNKGKNYVISLSQVTRWLGSRAEALGVDVYPGFAASRILYTSYDTVGGIITNDVGIARDGSKKDTYTPGMALSAGVTLFAEGCRGSLTKQVLKKYNLVEKGGADPQTYALGIKEVWEIDPGLHTPGSVWHTIGWPLPNDVYGGGWVYHMGSSNSNNNSNNNSSSSNDSHAPAPQQLKNYVSLGLVVGLDYSNPLLNPYQEFQRFKQHPAISKLLQGGNVVQYGARTLVEGGLQCLPALSFPGGALIGDAAGFLNVPKIKGTHTAMKSGMLAAESAFNALTHNNTNNNTNNTIVARDNDNLSPLLPKKKNDSPPFYDLSSYENAVATSWIHSELHKVRNIRPAFSIFGGLYGGIVHAALETYLFRGRMPWTLRHHHRRGDHEQLRPMDELPASSIISSLFSFFSKRKKKEYNYSRPDQQITFDIATSLHKSGTYHDHDQPCHLRLRNPKIPLAVNLPIYDGLESRYCPAGVYEYVESDTLRSTVVVDVAAADPKIKMQVQKRLQINAQNCLHCKACDIKDPLQNIEWTPPEGGGGPSYTIM